jgi:hypothetical protein
LLPATSFQNQLSVASHQLNPRTGGLPEFMVDGADKSRKKDGLKGL